MKILVISLAGIGDTLLATPLIAELRANFPAATIDALVLWAGSKDLLETNPHLNSVHQKNLMRCSKLDALGFLRSVRKKHFDVSINTHPQSRIHYRLIARIVGAPVRISHEYDCSGLLDKLLVNRTLPQDYARHTVAHNLDVLPLLGATPKLAHHDMDVRLTDADERGADTYVAERGLKDCFRLGIHVGSGGTKNLALKRWPLANYIQLIQKLNRERPEVKVLLFGGGDELREHQQIIAQTDRKLVLSAETKNLRQAGALLKRCNAFLSVDTALMHLAAAMKTPNQIVIEAPTLNPTNLPHGNPYTVVRNPISHGRQLEYYRYDGNGIRGTVEELTRCMAAVTVDAVWETLGKIMQKVG